jgi:hypothetical protein
MPAMAGFSKPIYTSPVAHTASYIMGTRSFPEVKWLGLKVNCFPPPNTVEVKEGMELYFYFSSMPFWQVRK